MATIITREVGATAKGTTLTNAEIDNNFINLNNELSAKANTASPTLTGTVTVDKLSVLSPGGDEGGEINLALAQTNNLLNGSVAIDINQSQLRIFETGGSNRGVFINLASAGAGVGTNLLVNAPIVAADVPNLDASKITTGTIAAARLPSYVDDVLEAANLAAFPATGETGKIYVALDTNKTYRWSGSAYVYITSGAVDSVAGKTGVVTLVKGDVGLGNVDNTSDASKPVSTATQTALNAKQATLVSGTSIKTVNSQSILGSGNIQIDGGVTSFNTRTGAVTLSSADVTSALGYTPLSNATSYLPLTGGSLSGDVSLPFNILTAYSTQTEQVNTSGLSVSNTAYFSGSWSLSYNSVTENIDLFHYGATGTPQNLTINDQVVLHVGNKNSYTYPPASHTHDYLPLSGGTLTGRTIVNVGGRALTVGGAPSGAPNAVIAAHDGYLEIVAGAGGATNKSGVVFHNPDISTSILEYVNTTSDAAYFNFRSDDVSWNVRVNNSIVLHASNISSYALPLSGGTLTGNLSISSGSVINFAGQSDTVGYNSTSGLGTYIKGTGSTYIYGGGSFYDGTAQRALIHAGNKDSYTYPPASHTHSYLPLSGGTLTGELTIATGGATGLRLNTSTGTQSLWVRAGYDSDGTATPVVSATNIQFQSSGSSGGTFSFVSGNTKALSIGGVVNSLVALQQSGNQVLHAGNYTSYSPGLTGTGASGTWPINITGSAGSVAATATTNLYSPNAATVVSGDAATALPSTGNSLIHTLATGPSGNDGHIIGMSWANTITSYGAQIWMDTDPTNRMAIRSRSSTGVWNGWSEVLSANNYSSYALPLSGGTLTGGLTVARKRLSFSSSYDDANHSIYNNYTNIDGEGGWDGMKMNVYNGLRIRTGNGSGAVPTQIFGLDSSGIRVDGGIRQGNNLARPLTEWSASGSSTGMVYIEMPGSSPGNYGMVHAVIDVYEYNGNAAATIIVGGHNWSGSWYNVSCNVIGATNKQVRLAVRNGKFVICLGDASSVWEYGTVMLRKIHNGSFYNNIMDMGAQFVIAQTTSEGLSGSSGDIRALRTPASFNAGGAITQAGNQVLHAGNYTSYSPSLGGSGASGTWGISVTGSANSLNLGGHTITNSSWAGGSGYHGYQYNGGNYRFGFSSTGGVLDVYADGNFYATDSSHLVLHAGNWTNYVQIPYTGWPGSPGADANTFLGGSWLRSSFTYSNNAPWTGPLFSAPAGGYDLQINGQYSGHEFSIRSRNGDAGSWMSWKRILTDHNYNTWAPTLTGGGASGTWSISITGNAATAYGLNVHGGRNNEANKVVRTDGNGYLQTGYINSSNGDENNSSNPDRVWGTNGSDSYLRTYRTSSLSVNYAASAGSANSVAWSNVSSRPTWMTSSSLVADHSNANEWRNSGFYENAGGGSNWPSATWYNSINVRHSNQGNYHGFQVAMSYYDNNLWFRSYQGSGTFQSWVYALSTGNYNNFAPTLTGGNASGTWGISITGNSATTSQTTFSEVYTNGWLRNNNSNTGLYNQATGNHWYSDGQYWNVGYSGTTGIRLRNGHAGTVLGYLYAETSGNFGLLHNGAGWAVQVYSGGNGYLHGTWNGGNIRANRANGNLYIDDNYGYGIVGTYASTRYQGVFAMGDSYKLPADGTGLGTLYGIAWSHPNAGGAAGNLTDHGMLIINNGSFRCAISNSIVASANITAYSDERLKTNWRDMPDNYVARLAQVKVGIYDRTDQENITQVGVSAQSFQKLLPESIMVAKDDMQTLSVNYGGAALASTVELAKDNVELRARIERLEALIEQILNKE